jgi:hypothetical protein
MLIAASSICAAQASEIGTVTLGFEGHTLDLETGAVLESSGPIEASDGDIRLAYNALRSARAVVVPEPGAEIVLFEGLAFDGVSAELLADLLFSPAPVDVAFDADVTVVVRTAGGAVYKLGNATESTSGVIFNYAAL